MKSLTRAIPLLVLAGSVGLACSSDGGDEVGGGGSRFTDRLCALLQPCCAALGQDINPVACELTYGFSGPVDATEVEACLADYEARAQDASWCASFRAQPPASCARAFPEPADELPTGNKLPGERCAGTADCAPSSRGSVSCVNEIDGSSRFCQVRVDAASGERCLGTWFGNGATLDGPPPNSGELPLCDLVAAVNPSNARPRSARKASGFACCASSLAACA